MSERVLAIFLHNLLQGTTTAPGAVREEATLHRLVAQPHPTLHTLLDAHMDALLRGWPAGHTLRPATIPATALAVGAALNNLAWSRHRTDKRLQTITRRLTEALPAAASVEQALAYHALLRFLTAIPTTQEWQPVITDLLERSPLTAAWLPSIPPQCDWSRLLALLHHCPVRVALRDRLLALPQAPATNLALGALLDGLLEHGGAAIQPFLLEFYEADCWLHTQMHQAHPVRTLLARVRRAHAGDDPLARRHATRLMARYRALRTLLDNGVPHQRYAKLDVTLSRDDIEVWQTTHKFRRVTRDT